MVSLRIEFPIFNLEQRLTRTKLMRAVYSSVLTKVESQKSQDQLNKKQIIRDLQLNQKSLSLIQQQREILKTQSFYVSKMLSKGDKAEVDMELQEQEQKKVELDFQMNILESNHIIMSLYQNYYNKSDWEDWMKFIQDNSKNTFSLKISL